MEHVTLEEAVAHHVRPGDTVQVLCGHSRWTAAAREMARQYWGSDAGFTLVMLSLSSLGALFFRGQMVRKVVTTYSGDTFPTYTPNPIFQEAYASGAVEVEHWSILTFTQRLEAAARGLPAIVTGSLAGVVDGVERRLHRGRHRPSARSGSWRRSCPTSPSCTARWPTGKETWCCPSPCSKGRGGRGRRVAGVVATVERVVESLDGLGHRVKIPAHRVLAVVEAPFGAHPGGLYAPQTPGGVLRRGHRLLGRGARRHPRRLRRLGPALGARAHHPRRAISSGWDASGSTGCRRAPTPSRGASDAEAHPVDATTCRRANGSTPRPTAPGSSRLSPPAHDADAVLAGAGVANLAAWVAVARARAGGSAIRLTAELGLWGYTPTPADPYIFNHRVFPGSPMLADASTVLGMVVGGPGTRTIACLGCRPGRPGREPQLHAHPRAGRSWWGPGAPTTWPVGPPRVSWWRWPVPTGWSSGSGFVTSPGAPGHERRHRPRGAAPARRRRCASPRSRVGRARWPSGCGRWSAACGWDVAVAASVGELDAGDDRRGARPAPLRPRAAVPVLTASGCPTSGLTWCSTAWLPARRGRLPGLVGRWALNARPGYSGKSTN